MLRPFDLKEAEHGAMICTRDGHPAQIVAVLGGIPARLLVKVAYYRAGVKSDDSFNTFENYYTNGSYLPPHEHPMDLFLTDNPGWT